MTTTDKTLEERAKTSIEEVCRATMYFIEGKLTREERESIYDRHMDFIKREIFKALQQERNTLKEKIEKMEYYKADLFDLGKKHKTKVLRRSEILKLLEDK